MAAFVFDLDLLGVTWQELQNTEPLFHKNRHIFKITRTGNIEHLDEFILQQSSSEELRIVLMVASKLSEHPAVDPAALQERKKSG